MTAKKKIKLELVNLLEHFEKKDYKPVLQQEENQLLITIKVEKIEFPLFVRIREGGDLLQLLVFFPCNTKLGCEADTARCLHLLNKELDIPGFGMDDANALIFYRCLIPCVDNTFNPLILDKFFDAIPNICSSFFPLIFSISQDKMKFEDIADRYDEMMDQAEEKIEETIEAK